MYNKNSKKLLMSLAAAAMMSIVPAVQAEVLDADTNGFTIRINTMVGAERMAVYKAAVERSGRWHRAYDGDLP
jgi:hypothetical protein